MIGLIFLLHMAMSHSVEHRVEIHICEGRDRAEGVESYTLKCYFYQFLTRFSIFFTNPTLWRAQMAPRENHIENNHEENTGVESQDSLEGIKSSLVGNINACGSHQDFRQALNKYFQYQQEHELGGYGSRFVPISKYLIFF